MGVNNVPVGVGVRVPVGVGVRVPVGVGVFLVPVGVGVFIVPVGVGVLVGVEVSTKNLKLYGPDVELVTKEIVA